MNQLLPDQRVELGEQLTSIVDSLTLDGEAAVDEVRATVLQIGRAARALRPMARTVVTAIDVVDQLRTSAEAWRDSVDR